MMTTLGRPLARRDFLAGAAAVTGGVTLVNPRTVRGTQANSAIEIGIIGTGSRGIWLADLIQKNTGMKVVALSDPFEDRLSRGRDKLGIDASRCYQGIPAYKDLIASKVDAVAVESPPYFHPEQVTAAVAAGKHVYLAKPVAVDVPGCSAIIQAGEKAKGKMSFLVDFQTRSTPFFVEAAKMVHEGAIGKPSFGHVYYHAGRLNPQKNAADSAGAARLRNWVFDKVLSGDIIVEQNVHVLDVANWFLQGHPLSATGGGGRKVRTDVGDCWDHFIVSFQYPGDVLVDFSSTQFVLGFSDLCTRVFGTLGTVDAHYEGTVSITGKNRYEGGSTKGMFATGAVANLKSFEESIRTGKLLNNAEESAMSSLTTILGRKAAYEGRRVTWDEMMRENAVLKADLVI
jgi:myo-inositol 2-dehydrogenase / D-chiro-inositol 1-dehydrogenase